MENLLAGGLAVDPRSVVAAVRDAGAADARAVRDRRVTDDAGARRNRRQPTRGVARSGDLTGGAEALPLRAITSILGSRLADRGAGRIRLAAICAARRDGWRIRGRVVRRRTVRRWIVGRWIVRRVVGL